MINTISNKGFISSNVDTPTSSFVVDVETTTFNEPVYFNGTAYFNGLVTGSGFPTPTTPGLDRLPLDASTIAMYYFDGNLNDSGPNGYHMDVSSGEVKYQIGPKRRKFVANEQPCAFTSSGAGLRTSGSMTFEFVGKGIPIGASVLATSGDGNTWNWSVQLSDSGRQVIKVNFSEFGWDTNPLLSDVLIPFNEVYYIAVTRLVSGGNTTTNIYLNGVNCGTQFVAGSTPRAADNTFHALSWHDNGYTYYENNGQNQARQMHICGRVMTVEEIQARAAIVLPPGYAVT